MRYILYCIRELLSFCFSLKIYCVVIDCLFGGSEIRDYVWLLCMDWSFEVMVCCLWGMGEVF